MQMARTRKGIPHIKTTCREKTYTGAFPLNKDPQFTSLNHKQQKFVYNIYHQPVSGWSNTKCYQEAYQNPNYNTSAVEANRLLKHPKVIYCLQKLRESYYNILNVTSDRVLDELSAISFSDLADYFDENGNLIKHPKELPAKMRRAISGFTAVYMPDGSIHYKVTLWNKSDGLKQLRQMLAMDKPAPAQKVEISGPNGKPIQIMQQQMDLTVLSDTDVKNLYEILNKMGQPQPNFA